MSVFIAEVEVITEDAVEALDVEVAAPFDVEVPSQTLVVEVIATGPQGPPGPSGSTGYSHHQASPAATWIITHSLGHIVEPVLLIDDAPNRQVWADYDYPDEDSCTITLPAPATGWAHF